MRKIFVLICLVPLMSLICNKPSPAFMQLFELTGGTWIMSVPEGFICEQWREVDDHHLKGRSFKIIGTDTTVLETMTLVEKDNHISYDPVVANNGNDKNVNFPLASSQNNTFIFSNPQHDFPQRIIYQFVSKDSLHAWIDGKYNGKEIKKDYYYRRVRE
jgi:hypothetical protein